MTTIIVKKYEHYNRALGKQITSRRHYEEEMKKGGYVSFEQGEKMVKDSQGGKRKDYKLSPKAKAIIETVRNSADKKGKVRLSDLTIDAMKEIGAIKKR